MQGLPHKRGFLHHIRGAQIFLCLRQAVAQQVLLFHRRNVIRRPETIVHPVFQSGFQFSGQHLRRGANPRGCAGIQGCLALLEPEEKTAEKHSQRDHEKDDGKNAAQRKTRLSATPVRGRGTAFFQINHSFQNENIHRKQSRKDGHTLPERPRQRNDKKQTHFFIPAGENCFTSTCG